MRNGSLGKSFGGARHRRGSGVLIVLFALALGCASPMDMLASFSKIERKQEGFTKHYQESFFALSEDKRFSVEVLLPGGSLQPGRNTVYFIVHNRADRDVEEADIIAVYRPEGGGASGSATIVEQGRGLYTTEDLFVPGPGTGDLFVTVSADGKTDTARFTMAAETVGDRRQ